MKYLKFFLVAGLTLMIILSYTTRTSGLSVGTNPGNLIPNFEIRDDSGSSFRLSELKGQKVLVSLWAAYDAESHMKNVLLWNSLQKMDQTVKMISVSFDQSKSVFEGTLEMDGINKESQYFETGGKKSEIYKKCQLAKGFGNYLIDENGVIMAKNVTPENLKKLLN